MWAWLCAIGMAAELRIAVLPFDDAGGQGMEALGVGLQSMITTDLAAADAVTVVERARLQDLLAEIDLGAKGVLDSETAAKVGKVSGATHVVVGSYTVVGPTMRLDARVSEVATGKVAAAAEASGERDAFFELEKTLVKALLAGLGAQLTAKERAAIGRIHTADFDAFEQFSRAVSLFDADRYQEAVALLESVAAKDADFKLAQVTLADVRAVRDEATQRARAATIAVAEETFVARREDAAQQAIWLEKLREIGRDPDADWRDRAAANLLTAYAIRMVGTRGPNFSALRESSDEFALDRAGERAMQAFWNELRPRVPEVWPGLTGFDHWPSDRRDFDAMRAHARKQWFEGTNPYQLLTSCDRVRSTEHVLSMLWLPEAQQLDAERALLDAASSCSALGEKRHEMQIELAASYTRLGRVGPATELLKQVSARSQDARVLAKVAAEAKRAEERLAELEQFPVGSVEREVLTHRAPHGQSTSARELLDRPERVLFRAHYALRSKFSLVDPFSLNGMPAWSLTHKGVEVVSGPRTGGDESASLRHYRDLRRFGSYGVTKAEAPTVWVIGGAPRADVVARVTLDFTPAADWWPMQFAEKDPAWAPLPARPAAGLLFGLTNLETQPICDPTDPTVIEPVPTRGYAALIRDGELILARVEESYPEPDRCTMRPNRMRGLEIGEVLARKPMKRDRAEIELRVVGSQVTASAGGATVKATLGAAPAGFVGLFADGEGYVELARPGWE